MLWLDLNPVFFHGELFRRSDPSILKLDLRVNIQVLDDDIVSISLSCFVAENPTEIQGILQVIQP